MSFKAFIIACVIFTSTAILTGCSDGADKKTADVQITIDFNKNPFPPEISDARGFSNPEPWGRWTVGEKATLTFNNPLPRQFELQILVHAAFGPNANKPVKLKIGESEHTFEVSTPDQIISIPVSLSTDTKVVEIILPEPTSPKSLGGSGDARKLGIAISKISLQIKQ